MTQLLSYVCIIHVCDMTQVYVCDMTQVYVCDMTQVYVCDMTQVNVCDTTQVYVCDMTYVYVCDMTDVMLHTTPSPTQMCDMTQLLQDDRDKREGVIQTNGKELSARKSELLLACKEIEVRGHMGWLRLVGSIKL